MPEQTDRPIIRIFARFDKWAPRLLTLVCAALIMVVVGNLLDSGQIEEDVSLGATALVALWGAHTWIQLLLVTGIGAIVLLGLLTSRFVLKDKRVLPFGIAFFTLLGAAYPFYWLGSSQADGEWVKQQSWAGLVRFAPVVVGSVGLAVFAWLCAAFPASGPNRDQKTWRRWGLTACLFFCSIGASIADAVVFPGLYPDFHFVVYLLASLFAGVATARLLNAIFNNAKSVLRRSIGVVSIVAAGLAVTAFASSDLTTRAELVQHSAVADAVLSNADLPREKINYFYEELEILNPNAGKFDEAPQLPRGQFPKTAPNGKPWNVALILIDAMRADVLPPVRKKNRKHVRLEDTPKLDAWSKDAFQFSRAYSQTSTTHRSLPPMFRSIHPFEMHDNIGVPLAEYMRTLGRVPVAVVNNYFVEPRVNITNALIDRFESVAFYNILEHDKIVGLTRETLAKVRDQPFFMWMHIYNLHAPGYAGRLLSKKDCSFKECYRKSLRWLDGCYAQLMAEFDTAGVSENTIFILASDHGELVGEHGRRGHGMTVFEEGLRIPLHIRIPGMKGRVLNELVSNVDVLPTIAEMLGAPINPAHRGRSLVPLLTGEKVDWDQPYYFENGRTRVKLNILAVIDGHDKLVYKRHQDLFFRYDLRHDPREKRNLYAKNEKLDTHLRRLMLRFNPIPFAKELSEPKVAELLHKRLAEVDPKYPGAALPWLLQLAALEGSVQSMDAAEQIFTNADDDRVKVRVLRYCFAKDRRRWARLIINYLKQLEGTPAELAFVKRLQMQGQQKFSDSYVGSRLSWWAEHGEPADWIPWLKLISTWRSHKVRSYGPPLEKMLRRIKPRTTDPQQVDIAWLLLENIRLLRRRGAANDTVKSLAKLVAPFFDHPQPDIQSAAGFALSVVGNKKTIPLLNRKLKSDRHLIKQAAFNALARVAGAEVTVRIAKMGAANSLLSMDAVWLLKEMGDERAIPYLQDIEKNHDDQFVRRYAKQAIEKIERRSRK